METKYNNSTASANKKSTRQKIGRAACIIAFVAVFIVTISLSVDIEFFRRGEFVDWVVAGRAAITAHSALNFLFLAVVLAFGIKFIVGGMANKIDIILVLVFSAVLLFLWIMPMIGSGFIGTMPFYMGGFVIALLSCVVTMCGIFLAMPGELGAPRDPKGVLNMLNFPPPREPEIKANESTSTIDFPTTAKSNESTSTIGFSRHPFNGGSIKPRDESLK